MNEATTTLTRADVVYPSNRCLSSKTRLFVDWVAEVFAPFDDR